MKAENAATKKPIIVSKEINIDNEATYIKNLSKHAKEFINVRKQGFYQRLFVAEILKEKGNALYKSKDFEAAKTKYEQAKKTKIIVYS